MTQQLDRKQIADSLSHEIILHDPEKVEDFINQNEDPQGFIDWINGMIQAVRKYFEHEPLSLKLRIDWESPGLTHLALLIDTKESYEEVREKLDEFEDKVWYEDMSIFWDKFSVNLAFK